MFQTLVSRIRQGKFTIQTPKLTFCINMPQCVRKLINEVVNMVIECISSLQICIANQYVSNHPSQRTEPCQTNGNQRILVHLKIAQISAIVCQFCRQQPKCHAKN